MDVKTVCITIWKNNKISERKIQNKAASREEKQKDEDPDNHIYHNRFKQLKVSLRSDLFYSHSQPRMLQSHLHIDVSDLQVDQRELLLQGLRET